MQSSGVLPAACTCHLPRRCEQRPCAPAVRPLPPPLSEPSACHHALCPCAVRSDYTPRAIPWRQPAHAQTLSLRSPGLRPAGLSPEPGICKLHSWLSVRQGASPFIHRAELRFKNGMRGPTGPGQRESIAEGLSVGWSKHDLSFFSFFLFSFCRQGLAM